MLVAPPEHLKTSIIEESLGDFSDALILTDLTTRDMAKVRYELAEKRYTTLALPEFQKIYDRDSRVAANLEGNIRALMEEGFAYIPGGSPDMHPVRAKALVVMGVTTVLYEENFERWKNQGFLRRLLVCRYSLHFPGLLSEAVIKWKKIRFRYQNNWKIPVDVSIPHAVTESEALMIMKWCKAQPGRVDPAALLHKILSVLRWKARMRKEKDESFDILKDFSECLLAEQAEVELK
jgi:hypothetical protein